MALTPGQAVSAKMSYQEDDTQVDSDLSKVASEIAMTSLGDSNSETDMEDDVVDDAVEIKDRSQDDLTHLWAPKVTEICVQKKHEETDKQEAVQAGEAGIEKRNVEDDKKREDDLSYLWAPKEAKASVQKKVEAEKKEEKKEDNKEVKIGENKGRIVKNKTNTNINMIIKRLFFEICLSD